MIKQIERRKLLNCREAAAYTGFSESRIRYETFINRIPHVKIGRSVRFTEDQLNEWIDKSSRGNKDV